MTVHPIPKGWEQCAPAESTQAWVSLDGSMLPVVLNLDHDCAIRINGEWISEQSWPALGIIPIRRSPPPPPIEFTVKDMLFHETHTGDNHGHPVPRGFQTMRVPEGVTPGMKFRQVVEEDEKVSEMKNTMDNTADVTAITFTEDEIRQVRDAIQVAREDIGQWRRATVPTREQMQQVIHPYRNGKRLT